MVVVVIEHKLLLLSSSFSLRSLELEALWLVLGSNPSQLFFFPFFFFFFFFYFVGFCGWLVIGPNPSQPFLFLFLFLFFYVTLLVFVGG